MYDLQVILQALMIDVSSSSDEAIGGARESFCGLQQHTTLQSLEFGADESVVQEGFCVSELSSKIFLKDPSWQPSPEAKNDSQSLIF
jgi:hypothetical protein